MKTIFLILFLFSFPLAAKAFEVPFEDIQKRATSRNEITKAILKIDNHLRFKLTIEGDKAEVKIWKHMKVKDLNAETYTFKVTDDILQEYSRLKLQEELQAFTDKCSLVERKYRISKFKEQKLHWGMPYKDVKEILGEEYKEGSLRALAGSKSLESDNYIIEFRGFKLFDIIIKKTSNE